jgi:hypothetical protein
MWRTEWEVFGGICVAIMVSIFVRHVYYIVKHVWPAKLQLRKPQRVLPVPGVATIHGIVSGIGEKCPVQVTIVEYTIAGASKGQFLWEQTSYKVEAHPFVLLLPELGARILVEPTANVRLRAFGHATDWELDEEVKQFSRVRTATLEDGDRAIITGMLEEKREVELVANQYRSQKENVRIEYVLKPGPNVELRVDSETFLDEIQRLLGPLGWARGIGTASLVTSYVYALQVGFSPSSKVIFGALVVAVVITGGYYRNIDRRPWFDRPINPPRPYRFSEDMERREPG